MISDSAFDLFDNFETKNTTGNDAYIDPGSYVLELNQARYFASERDPRNFIFLFRWKIVESNNPSLPSGTFVADPLRLDKGEPILKVLKTIMVSLSHKKPAEIDKEWIKKFAMSEGGDYIGTRVRCDARQGTTRAGNPITYRNYGAWKSTDEPIVSPQVSTPDNSWGDDESSEGDYEATDW